MSESISVKKRKKKKNKNAVYIMEILLCIIALSAITVSMILVVKYRQLNLRADALQAKVDVYEDPDDPYLSRSTADEMISAERDIAYIEGSDAGRADVLASIKEELIESDSSIETLKNYYPDDLIVVHNNEILFFPILDSITHHTYDRSLFATGDDGRITYNESGVDTESWIDVSRFQEKIDWSRVADDHIDAAIIRVGYRGYSKGDIMDDDTFEYNIKGALDHGLKAGVYFLTQATSDSEATEEAEYVLDMISDYDISGPVVLDVELVGGDDGRGNRLAVEERTKYAKTFLDTVREAGYETCIYGNLKTFLIMLDLEELEDYSKWFAGYTDVPYYPYSMDMWQYTDTGRVDGISGNVDINIRFIK